MFSLRYRRPFFGDRARTHDGFCEDYRRVDGYEGRAKGVRAVAAAGDVLLVETLADRIAELALADPRARRAEVAVEKLDVFPYAEAAGVTVIHRKNRSAGGRAPSPGSGDREPDEDDR